MPPLAGALTMSSELTSVAHDNKVFLIEYFKGLFVGEDFHRSLHVTRNLKIVILVHLFRVKD